MGSRACTTDRRYSRRHAFQLYYLRRLRGIYPEQPLQIYVQRLDYAARNGEGDRSRCVCQLQPSAEDQHTRRRDRYRQRRFCGLQEADPADSALGTEGDTGAIMQPMLGIGLCQTACRSDGHPTESVQRLRPAESGDTELRDEHRQWCFQRLSFRYLGAAFRTQRVRR